MSKLKKGISFKFILIFIVTLMVMAQVIVLPYVNSKTVRSNILKNTTILTQGIMDQSKNYINLLLKELDSQINLLMTNEKLNVFISEEGLSEKTITHFLQNIKKLHIISSFVIINTDNEKESVLLYPDSQRYKYLSPESKEDFLSSQQAELLKENNSRRLWMGSAPTGLYDAIPSLWTYQYMTINSESYIIGASLSRNEFVKFLAEVASSARSDVLLLTADNIVYPNDNNFFDNSFAAKALSRSINSRYNILYETRETSKGPEQLMIQIYTDPDYFYNLIILTPQDSLLRGFNAIQQTSNLTLIILAVFSITMAMVLIYLVNIRIKAYIAAVNDITRGQYNITLEPARIPIEEDVTLTYALQNMADEIQKNRNSLKYSNENLEKIISQRSEELQRSLNELHMTRQSLIHSEKMASLGRQGAKIAHEMNNPLSVAITASSHMSSTVKDINRKFESKTMTKSDFISLTSTAVEVSDILQRNLNQAAEMTARFKNFAYDQSREERKKIRIGNYINEILKSYDYKLKNTAYTLKLTCDEDIEIYTDPSIIYQIITNLINNSVLHGFEDRKSGQISIDVHKTTENISIIYADDGKGISEEVISQLYKPFFTTKAGEGGTGLGLNIIKDLIDKELKGSIKCISSLGKGTRFTITFPC